MFGSKKAHNGQGVTTLIARNTQVEGTVRYSGELDIEGVIAGDIFAEDGSQSIVKILEHGRVDGEVRAPEVIINGHVAGDVYATGQLYLADKAVVEGNVHYNTIEMEKGAQIDGKLVHLDEKNISSTVAPITKPAADKSSKSKSDEAAQPELATVNT